MTWKIILALPFVVVPLHPCPSRKLSPPHSRPFLRYLDSCALWSPKLVIHLWPARGVEKVRRPLVISFINAQHTVQVRVLFSSGQVLHQLVGARAAAAIPSALCFNHAEVFLSTSNPVKGAIGNDVRHRPSMHAYIPHVGHRQCTRQPWGWGKKKKLN